MPKIFEYLNIINHVLMEKLLMLSLKMSKEKGLYRILNLKILKKLHLAIENLKSLSAISIH